MSETPHPEFELADETISGARMQYITEYQLDPDERVEWELDGYESPRVNEW
jgi:hypothetical protein